MRFWLCWLGGTLGVLAYAALDLFSNPALSVETSFSVVPDIAKLPDLAHWGGRLLNHQAWGLLVANAIIFGGLIALVVSFIWNRFRPEPVPETIGAYDSVPPPTMRAPYSRD